MTITYSPRIWVASLSDYNNGHLHGVWIDAAQDVDAIHDEIAAMLRDSKYPNVEVECPQCAKKGFVTFHNSETGDTRQGMCPTCDGKGTVPSAEEWAIHDSEDWAGIKISEHESIDTITELAAALEEHGEPWAKWWNNEYRDGADVDTFQDVYRGHYKSLEEYVEEYCEDCLFSKDTPEVLKTYFNFEAFGRDMELGGDIWTTEASDGGIYIYDNH